VEFPWYEFAVKCNEYFSGGLGMHLQPSIQDNAINTIRFLSVDSIRKANSGHPGLPMGTAAIAYTIWTRHLRHNPRNPNWFNRDRFVLSGGHGSMLLYSLLHLTGYDLGIDDLKNFRKLGSRTPGHPEFGVTPGVETTTGPLGQGFANGVGMAITEAHLAALFNKPGYEIVNHFVYAIVTDGDLMEGVSSEAASLAGHLQLGKLIYFYDDNRISIDGSTEISFTENRAARFKSYGWHVQEISDGNDVEAIDQAVKEAKADMRPSIIICRTHIGYGLPTLQDSPKAHGEPPPQDEIDGAKRNFGWPLEPKFYISEQVLEHFREAISTGDQLERDWYGLFLAFKAEFPDLASELARRFTGRLRVDWQTSLPEFPVDEKGMATREASGKVINAIAQVVPELIGGSADLAPSNKTWITGEAAFQAETPEGRNFFFGVREHAMGGIVNGMAYHGGVIPYGGTFLVFSDYMRGALRLAALSHLHDIWVFTHDSIGVGEDGPTHQPVEHFAALRAIPNLVTLRPGDANEVVSAWRFAIEEAKGPTALFLSRQGVPTLDREKYEPAEGLINGAYVLADLGDAPPEIILMASGTEVSLIVAAGEALAAEGISVRLVSFPSWELFEDQSEAYKNEVIPSKIRARLAVEAGVSQGWHHWVGDTGDIISVNGFGASAPYNFVYNKFGLTTENVITRAKALLK
jgi:transketolase